MCVVVVVVVLHYTYALPWSNFPLLSSHQGPTLFIIGRRSTYVNILHDKEVILSHFPRATFAVLDAGHWVHHERPAEFVKEVVDFVSHSN